MIAHQMDLKTSAELCVAWITDASKTTERGIAKEKFIQQRMSVELCVAWITDASKTTEHGIVKERFIQKRVANKSRTSGIV
jgi:hypothetical protein